MYWGPVNTYCEPVIMSWEHVNMSWELVNTYLESHIMSYWVTVCLETLFSCIWSINNVLGGF
jgi:hypothetical protein